MAVTVDCKHGKSQDGAHIVWRNKLLAQIGCGHELVSKTNTSGYRNLFGTHVIVVCNGFYGQRTTTIVILILSRRLLIVETIYIFSKHICTKCHNF